MANAIYNSFKQKIMSGAIDLDTDTIKVALVTSSYVPNIDSDDFFNDVTNEVVGTGYTAGGVALTGTAVTQDNPGDAAYFDANDASWASSTLTARGCVVYKSTGTAATSPLICYIDFGSDRTSSADTFLIQWAATGIVRLT